MGCGSSTATKVADPRTTPEDTKPLLVYSHGNTYRKGDSLYGPLLRHNPESIDETWLAVCETLDVPKGQKNPNSGLVVKRSGWKTVRIFVSSTFKDFQHEREILVKQVFPDLRAWCEKRRLHLVDCDLRWGIPKDSTTELTLRTCLGEIDRCYADNIMPYFLNMTSERIGWVPTPGDIPQSLVEEYRWIFGLSVTEMEILHGAYRKDNPNSLFLMRNDDFLASVPDNLSRLFIDEHPLASAKLKMLRSKIKDRFPEDRIVQYSCKFAGVDPETGKITLDLDNIFYQKILEFFKGRISQQYPLDEAQIDPYQQVKESHESFMKQRCDHVWGRKLILEEIEKYVSGAGNDVPLLVLGSAGQGKSSIMAKSVDLTITRAMDHKIPGAAKYGWHVFYHFVGAVPGSTDLEGTLKRLLVELGIVDESTMPKDLEETSQLCSSALTNMNTKPVIIFIDALNQLKEDGSAISMTWVPRKLAPHVRCIFSMIPDTPQHVNLLKRFPENKPQLLTVPPLNLSARKDIVAEVLGRYQKRLTVDQMIELLAKQSSSNPLWLSIACEELRVFGDFQKISEKVESLRDGLLELLCDVLGRFELENGGHLLVATLCLLETSSSGLLESELLTILSEEENLMPPKKNAEKGEKEKSEKEGKRFKGEQLSAFKWAQVYRALRTFLRPYGDSGEGRLDFYHRSLSKAVRKKYFKVSDDGIETAESKKLSQWWHKVLAEYFQHTDMLDRKVEEYPHHLLALKDEERMTQFLMDDDVIDKLFEEEYSSTLFFYWREGGGGVPRLIQIYKDLLHNMFNMVKNADTDRERLALKAEKMAYIFYQAGSYWDAANASKLAYTIEEKALGNRPERIVELATLQGLCVHGKTKIYDHMVPEMLPFLRESIQWSQIAIDLRKTKEGKFHRCKLAKLFERVAFCLSNIAQIGGDEHSTPETAREEGSRKLEAAIKIYEEFNNHGQIPYCLMTKASLQERGDAEQLKLYKKALDVCQQVYGDYSVLAGRIYLNTGIHYEEIEDYQNAYECFQNNYRIHLQVFGKDHKKTVRVIGILNEPPYKLVAESKGEVLPDKPGTSN